MSQVAHAIAPAATGASASRTLLFGAVRFELMSDFAELGLLEEHERFVEPSARGTVVAEVTAALCAQNVPRATHALEIVRSWDGDRAAIDAGDVHTQLTELRPSRYVARARVSPDALGVSTFLSSTTSTIVERLGGVILHAAGVVVDGRAVLFVGPSGAGKTTAANLCSSAAWIAKDRAAVVPHQGGYVVFGMPGGDELTLPRAPTAAHPLACVARIRRDRPEITALPLDTLEALAVLRESTFAGGDEAVEEARLDALLALASRVRVWDLHTRLGASLDAVLTELVA